MTFRRYIASLDRCLGLACNVPKNSRLIYFSQEVKEKHSIIYKAKSYQQKGDSTKLQLIPKENILIIRKNNSQPHIYS